MFKGWLHTKHNIFFILKYAIFNFRLEIRIDENRITADEIKLSGMNVDKTKEDHGQSQISKMSSDLQSKE